MRVAWRQRLAAVLLLSDGANSTGSYPPDVARVAAARHVPVFAVAVGTPGGVLIRRAFTTEYQFPTGAVSCEIRLDLTVVERTARDWGLPVTQVVAALLTHEQEHCIRDPDDRETLAIDAERRLARKLGAARLLDFVASRYRELDSSGHWRS